MAGRKTTDPHEGMRRFLDDFRASGDRRDFQERRKTDRRVARLFVETERRDENRRGESDRRVVLTDRRRRNSEIFSRTDAHRISEMILHPSVEVECPQCGGRLLLGPMMPRAVTTAREVHCTACRRSIVISNLPSETPGPP